MTQLSRVHPCWFAGLGFSGVSRGKDVKPDAWCLLPGLTGSHASKHSSQRRCSGFPGSLNTCAVSCTRKASASLEINYQGPFNELLASYPFWSTSFGPLTLLQLTQQDLGRGRQVSRPPTKGRVSPLLPWLLRCPNSCQCLKFHHHDSFLWA